MHKKLIALALLSTLMLTACGQQPSETVATMPTAVPTETKVEVDDFMKDTVYILDTINETELNTLVDALIASEPAAGTSVDDMIDGVKKAIGHNGDGYGLFSYGSDIVFELGNTAGMENDGAYIQGRDNVCKMTWNGYTFVEGSTSDVPVIEGNSESYTNPLMPGSAGVELHIFDETRADEAYQIFKARLEADYPEATITEDYTGYDATDVSADGTKTVYAEVNKWYNDTIGCYVVTYTVYFRPIEPMIEDDAEVITDEEVIQSSIDEVGEDPSNN